MLLYFMKKMFIVRLFTLRFIAVVESSSSMYCCGVMFVICCPCKRICLAAKLL